MNIHEKLMKIQSELKAPKSQFNSFGKYKYRNMEDILEALKPLLAEYKAIVNVSDEVQLVGDRYYIKATAKIIDAEKDNQYVESIGYAREDENKRGMDLSQLTGSTSSYARKYALNGLFAIDDTRDSDATNASSEKSKKSKKKIAPTKKQSLSDAQIKRLYAIAHSKGIDPNAVKARVKSQLKKEIKELTKKEYDMVCKAYEDIEQYKKEDEEMYKGTPFEKRD